MTHVKSDGASITPSKSNEWAAVVETPLPDVTATSPSNVRHHPVSKLSRPGFYTSSKTLSDSTRFTALDSASDVSSIDTPSSFDRNLWIKSGLQSPESYSRYLCLNGNGTNSSTDLEDEVGVKPCTDSASRKVPSGNLPEFGKLLDSPPEQLVSHYRSIPHRHNRPITLKQSLGFSNYDEDILWSGQRPRRHPLLKRAFSLSPQSPYSLSHLLYQPHHRIFRPHTTCTDTKPSNASVFNLLDTQTTVSKLPNTKAGEQVHEVTKCLTQDKLSDFYQSATSTGKATEKHRHHVANINCETDKLTVSVDIVNALEPDFDQNATSSRKAIEKYSHPVSNVTCEKDKLADSVNIVNALEHDFDQNSTSFNIDTEKQSNPVTKVADETYTLANINSEDIVNALQPDIVTSYNTGTGKQSDPAVNGTDETDKLASSVAKVNALETLTGDIQIPEEIESDDDDDFDDDDDVGDISELLSVFSSDIDSVNTEQYLDNTASSLDTLLSPASETQSHSSPDVIKLAQPVSETRAIQAEVEEALTASISEQSMLPILKQELKMKIQVNRLKRGKSELVLEPPPTHKHFPLTPEEIERRERRLAQNRTCASNARIKKSARISLLKREYRQLMENQVELQKDVSSLLKQRDGLQKTIDKHMKTCTRHKRVP